MDSGFMHQFVQQLINGVSLGSIYALIALGYTMIYGILKLINFAHGDVYMLGAYIGFFCTSMLKLSFLPSIIVAMVGTALAGMIIERVAYRPMRNAPRIAILITAIGVSFFLENAMILFASPQPRTFPAVFSATVYHFGALVINSQQIVILVSAIVLMIALTYIVNYTKIGKAMRAVSFDADAARLMGIRAKGAGGVLLIGALGGFAPAAVAASEAVRTGQLTSRQASALLPACVCSGPSFVILTVGQQMLGSRAVGVRLFAAQLLAGYLTAALLCRMQGGAGQAPPAQGKTIPLPALDAVIAQAAVTYLKLCGFVLYFRLLAAGCGALLPQPWAALPAMLLEVCSGCDQAARTGLWASTLCCAALSVQGVSVLLQVRTICPAEISLRPLLAARAVHLPLSVALFWLGSTVPVQAVQTFTTLTERVVVLRRVPLDCALLAFAVCCITVEELAR